MTKRSQYTATNYKRVAELHVENLDQSFLAELGVTFLTSLYEAIDRSTDAVLITAERKGQIVGFVTGAPSLGPIYKAIIPNILRWVPSLSVRLLSPRRLKRVFDILRHTGPENPDWPDMELLSIAVDPSQRGQGVAQDLYQGLIDHCRSKDIPAFRIMVGNTLAPAHRFYRKMGAREVGSMELHRGEISRIYIHEIKAEPNLVQDHTA